ncbi:class I SAM-dependent methyltransferase [uncultured Eudoraea sp.]|uniref:class I SAM-dependent methyltransferase n=1 Tax=uncultured Eudoraea sp. TaxID=1035614 RepID=UPI002630B697|nr:class I SAM-dependent methyltransferase [uncultured Eudoraea sp.]
MLTKINIHETAFVTASFRMGDVALSKDRYAYLWSKSSIDIHAERYSTAVSSYEPYAHCLRNRYFYDTINELMNKNKIEVLINFGCGFSMYPYLLENSLDYIEIDKSDVVTHKKEMTTKWEREGKLPRRKITYLEADFNLRSQDKLYEQVIALKNGRKSFILLEGVLFFLSKDDTKRLFKLFDRIQEPDEYLGSVSFLPQLEKQLVFKKLIDYVESNLEKNKRFQYQTVAEKFYRNLKNYELMNHEDTFSLSARYEPKRFLPKEEVLNEHMYLLKKTSIQ